MKCPTCGAWTRVLETRHDGLLRRRECANQHRFITEEKVIFVPATGRRMAWPTVQQKEPA